MSIGIDILKAKELHKQYIRNARNSILVQKDVEYMRALESGNTKLMTSITAEKQALRDATGIVDNSQINATNVKDVTIALKKVWDEKLLGTNPLL